MASINETERRLAGANAGELPHPRTRADGPSRVCSARNLDEWTETVMHNMKRMATDEAYRTLIALHGS